MTYSQFLEAKTKTHKPCGFEPKDLNPDLFPFQADLVRWALVRGRAALFADTGLGKTIMQLVWADEIHRRTGRPVLILAPLAVSHQTQREGIRFGIDSVVCREMPDEHPGIIIANYEMLHHFDQSAFAGVVLDESSILKSFSGTVRKQITEFASTIDYRLACTATPAPNDLIEITNHAEFLGVMSGKEIIALFFTQDGNSTLSWRLKGHARDDFWQWLATWASAVRTPADLGYPAGDFVLPELEYIHSTVAGGVAAEGMLFAIEAQTMPERLGARRATINHRVERAAEIIEAEPGESWVVWCNLNMESAALKKRLAGSVEVKGSDTREHKEQSLNGFSDGNIRILITKPSIAGFGMNWQHCARMAFVGLNDSWEQLYQATRRCWRYGQQREVHAHIITAQIEGAVIRNIKRKNDQATQMIDELVSHMRGFQMTETTKEEMTYETSEAGDGDSWRMMLGDCVERIADIETESVGLSVFSPPFPAMYAYTNSARDMGNTENIGQMIEHFRYLASPKNLLRITKPGRMACVHLMQVTAMKSRDGYIGIRDYRGQVIKMFEDEGWIYTGEVTIEKNPQIQATRHKERGLLFKSLAKDSSLMRMALADYLIYFKKPGENQDKIRAGVSERYDNPEGWITEEEWIEWASPVWYRKRAGYPGGISETDVLNVRAARQSEDERHLCPLQLGVIERAVKLWSAPGDLVFSPFAGIGSEGYVSLMHGRRFVGVELKRSYFEQACRNLAEASSDTRRQLQMFNSNQKDFLQCVS